MELTVGWSFAVTFLLIGLTLCQIENNLDDIKKKIQEEFPDLQDFDPSKIPEVEAVEKAFSEKCDKVGGEGTYANLQEQKEKFQECLNGLVNITEAQEEVELAKATGSMDEVFGKYCNKFPELKKCGEDLVTKLNPCLEQNEKDSLNLTLGISYKLKEFACFKNGDRIAMFVAQGGVACIESQKKGLEACLNDTLASRLPSEFSITSIPVLLFDTRDCNDMATIRTCVKNVLEQCSDSTPANLVDAFFKYLKKIVPCQDGKLQLENTSKVTDTKGNDASKPMIKSLFVFVLLFMSRFV